MNIVQKKAYSFFVFLFLPTITHFNLRLYQSKVFCKCIFLYGDERLRKANTYVELKTKCSLYS